MQPDGHPVGALGPQHPRYASTKSLLSQAHPRAQPGPSGTKSPGWEASMGRGWGGWGTARWTPVALPQTAGEQSKDAPLCHSTWEGRGCDF